MFEEFRLSTALLLYEKNTSYGTNYYFQTHDVAITGEGPVLLAGKPLTIEALTELCAGIVPSLFNDRLSFLDNRLLASSGTVQGPDIWWVPSQKRPMFFAKEIAKKIENGTALCPGLVFVACKGRLQVYAVKGNCRPELKTKLYVAPFFNMRDSTVCLGDAQLPAKNSGRGTWERAFFESAFSELHEEGRVKDLSLIELWSGLIKNKTEKFPEKYLKPCIQHKTLESLIEFAGREFRRG